MKESGKALGTAHHTNIFELILLLGTLWTFLLPQSLDRLANKTSHCTISIAAKKLLLLFSELCPWVH